MVDYLKEYAESVYTDQEMETLSEKYTYARPFTKESLLYREIFEKYYPGQAEMIAGFWMPNKEWEGCDVNDLQPECFQTMEKAENNRKRNDNL